MIHNDVAIDTGSGSDWHAALPAWARRITRQFPPKLVDWYANDRKPPAPQHWTPLPISSTQP